MKLCPRCFGRRSSVSQSRSGRLWKNSASSAALGADCLNSLHLEKTPDKENQALKSTRTDVNGSLQFQF